MKLEYQVVSLELSKKLKELGVEQDSLFYWADDDDLVICVEMCTTNLVNNKVRYISSDPSYHKNKLTDEIYSAFTVAELGELLPKKLKINDIYYFLTQIPNDECNLWIIFYRSLFRSLKEIEFFDEKESDLRAKMLIYLIENGVINN